ncbi:DegT/DnrJ/EryC1/StrS family aminotransferase [Maribacter cobaltidurans]|uniref:Pyridoxal phosphate-dependent aminotransferase n=1 Tax=Maribacter cobaltidurans TaxID=1178778 RepID=A0A223V090_9FLAO|nr:DegT/DnrJ/EryC1/StrS family aminotransferase [Maribacter cobaltidurans]ASV28835.1 pyridoxal phosphate-dependent aminotransferase [Maribacter cobaltidurans]GGD74407.1 pyridoxal phosphate-dependent aminotransferase [Maribacter cobaltidurans]
MGGKELNYIHEAFDTNWVAPLGPNVNGFEKAIEVELGQGVYAAALSSGTGAIHLGLKLLGVGVGDEVVCQSFTFSASANPILYLGAKPIFVDSERDTWNINPELLRKAIENRIRNFKKPKAIIAVHLYGMPYKIEAVRAIADEFQIPILEDSAEALGSSYKGISCGTFGNIGILSFNGNKIITTSGGGALVSKDKEIRDKAIFLATQARDDAPHYQHSHVGYNYRMSNVLAGIGRGQMEVLGDRVKARRKNYDFYVQALEGCLDIHFLSEPKDYFSNRWLSCILTSGYDMREMLRNALLEENIESRPLWKPLHLQPIFSTCAQFMDGTSEDLFNRGLCLPSGSNLEQEDLERVVATIKNALS